MAPKLLQDRRVLITGASSGIGAAAVRACAAQGARVAGMARRAERLRELEVDCGMHPVEVDLADPERVPAEVVRAADALGGLDAVVHSAGVYLLMSIEEARQDEWRRMFEVNVFSVLSTTRAALPFLRGSPTGQIVNISSLGGQRVARTTTSLYSATKYALNALTEGMRMEFRPHGIRVSSIAPGSVRTEMGTGTSDEQLLAELRARQADVGIAAQAVADSIVHTLAQPVDVEISDIAIRPRAQER